MNKKRATVISLLFTCCLISGCGNTYSNNDILEENVSSGWKEEKIILATEHVLVSEDDYKEIKKRKAFIRDTLIDNPNAKEIKVLMKKARELIGEEWLANKGWEYYLSCVPLISWNYEKNCIDDINTGLVMFDEAKENVYLMQLAKDTLNFTGFVTMSFRLMQTEPDKRYLWTKADYYTSCFIGSDNKAYEDSGYQYTDDSIEIQGNYYGKFDINQIGVSMTELTDLSNCIKVVLSDI